MALQAAAAFSTIALRSAGRLSQARFVDHEFGDGGGLVPASGVVVLGYLLQAELPVEERANEFGRIDDAALQRREDFTSGKQTHVNAKLLIDTPGEAGNAHLQTLEILDLLHRLPEPAGHLHAGVATGDRHQVEALVGLLPQVQAAAVIEPAVDALEIQPEGTAVKYWAAKLLPVQK